LLTCRARVAGDIRRVRQSVEHGVRESIPHARTLKMPTSSIIARHELHRLTHSPIARMDLDARMGRDNHHLRIVTTRRWPGMMLTRWRKTTLLTVVAPGVLGNDSMWLDLLTRCSFHRRRTACWCSMRRFVSYRTGDPFQVSTFVPTSKRRQCRSAAATVTITVTPVNEPCGMGDAYAMAEELCSS